MVTGPMDVKLSNLMRPKKAFPTGTPAAIVRVSHARGGHGPDMTVTMGIVACDPSGGEHEICSVQMLPTEAEKISAGLEGTADFVKVRRGTAR